MAKQLSFLDYNITKKEDIPNGMVKVKFSKEVSKFVGIDLRTYGKFFSGNIAIIPILNSNVLILKKACILIK